jgi:hypothetical protein
MYESNSTKRIRDHFLYTHNVKINKFYLNYLLNYLFIIYNILRKLYIKRTRNNLVIPTVISKANKYN